MFSEKATKIEEIFTVDLTLRSKCQIEMGAWLKIQFWLYWISYFPVNTEMKSISVLFEIN